MPRKAAATKQTKATKRTAKEPAKLRPGDPLPEDVEQLFQKHVKYLQAGRANYARADKALEEILQRCEPGVEYVLPGSGRKPPMKLTLVDQFAETNAVWSGSSCKRMKIDQQKVKPQDRPAK